MSRTIAGTYNAGITLTAIADSPVSVTGTIVATGSAALAAIGGPGYGWSIDNAGTITSYSGAGIYLGSPGSLVTDAILSNESGGTIGGDLYGVVIAGAGTVSNVAGGLISGGSGVVFRYGVGTLDNAGIIAGTSGNAVSFGAIDPGNRLIAEPGGSFYGNVDGGGGVLELASGSGALGGVGMGVTNFSSLVFDQGAQWIVAGTGDAAGFGTIDIVGFTIGDTIELLGFVAVQDSFASNLLTLTDTAASQVTLQIEGTFASGDFALSSDGSGDSDITIGASAGPPAIAGTYPNQALLDNATLQPFAVTTIADSNNNALDSVSITLLVNGSPSDADGMLSGTGLARTAPGTYALAVGDAADVTAALQALVFTPTAHQVAAGDEVTTGMTLLVSDDASGTPVVDSNTSVVVTAVNDPPAISGTRAGQALSAGGHDQPFSNVTIGDPDFAAIETVTVTLLANGMPSDAIGTLSGTGLSETGVGSYTLAAAAPDAATAALRALTFTPTSPTPGTTRTTTMRLSVSDGIVTQPVIDATTSVVTTAPPAPPPPPGPPAINGTPPPQTAVSGGGPVVPFAGVSISDAGAGGSGNDTLTITLSDSALGSLTNLGGGSFDAATGTYTLTGTPGAIGAALQVLTFTPTVPADGFVNTTGFSISITGTGGSDSNTSSLTAVQQVLGLAALPTGLLNISSSPDGTGFAAAQDGMTNEAVVTAPSADAIYTLPTGYQAEFLGATTGSTLTDRDVGNAVLVGNDGNDSITATAGNDSIVAGNGNDTLTGGTGAVGITAGSGDDLIIAANASSFSISGGNGNDTIVANGAGTLQGGTGSNELFGSNGATIASAGAQDTLAALGGSVTAQANGAAPIVFGNFSDATASLTVMTSGAQATVSAGEAPITVTSTGGDAIVFGGFTSSAGSLNVVATGSNTTIAGGISNTSATLSGTNALLFGSYGAAATLNVVDAGTGDTIAAGNSAATITATSASHSLLVFGGSSTLDFAGSSGTATVVAGAGATSITGGGAMTMFGAAGNVTQFTGDGSTLYEAGGGAETLNAGNYTGNLEAVGGADPTGAQLILGGSGNDTLFAGAGAISLAGGAGTNLFSFDASLTHGSADVVLDFSSSDQVSLIGYGANAATLALADAVSQSGNTTIALADNTHITFLNVASANALQGRVFAG